MRSHRGTNVPWNFRVKDLSPLLFITNVEWLLRLGYMDPKAGHIVLEYDLVDRNKWRINTTRERRSNFHFEKPRTIKKRCGLIRPTNLCTAHRDVTVFQIIRPALRPLLASTGYTVAGDLNAKSPAWGPPMMSARGETLCAWAVRNGLAPGNLGKIPTCFRLNGTSRADVTLCDSAAIVEWKLRADLETLR